MTRRITQTFHGWGQRDVVVTLAEDQEHAGEHSGLLRAWAVDDETGDWWAMCNYYVGPGMQMLGWVHQDHLRPVVELTDGDGLVAANVVALPQRDA
ncbi:hypothetical protein [Nocardioides astragali]|uniref:Uncharacterized protein n=1 Tax=Nocardioides astragali TaxID=1776736 RepID=A0ABW2N6Z6_9ACTN|nr:hypothetical protein [Nocardioides astragali]